MVFRFCPQCGKEPLAHNARRMNEFACPDCKGAFVIAPAAGHPSLAAYISAVGQVHAEDESPQASLAAATAELEEVADFELRGDKAPGAAIGSFNNPHPQPAFPVPIDDGQDWHVGMSLLDWFAGQALAGIMANPAALKANPPLSHAERAEACYGQAAAMMLLAKKGGAS